MADTCRNCGRELTADEIGIYKRMVNRGAADFLCASCLAAHFKIDEALVYEKIEHFRAMGCTLFAPKKDSRTSSPETGESAH